MKWLVVKSGGKIKESERFITNISIFWFFTAPGIAFGYAVASPSSPFASVFAALRRDKSLRELIVKMGGLDALFSFHHPLETVSVLFSFSQAVSQFRAMEAAKS